MYSRLCALLFEMTTRQKAHETNVDWTEARNPQTILSVVVSTFTSNLRNYFRLEARKRQWSIKG